MLKFLFCINRVRPTGKRQNICKDKIFIQSNITSKCAIRAYKLLEPARSTALSIMQCRSVYTLKHPSPCVGTSQCKIECFT